MAGQPAEAEHAPAYHALQYAQWPAYEAATDAAEAAIYRHMLAQGDDPAVSRGEVLVIPVVFHVMHLPEDSVPAARSSNIPAAQIQAGLDWLNDAVRNRGPYAGGPFFTDAGIASVDLEIEFCLAQLDPDGHPTDGIVRVPTPLSNLHREAPCPGDPNQEQDHCLRAASFWDSYRYMNIWLVNNICDQAGGICDFDGYSLMVGSHGQLYDGPVLKASFWGNSPADQARLIRHVGHYLNLFDTYFQPLGPSSACLNQSCLMQGDRVCDTPPDAGPGAGDCANGERVNSCTTDGQDTSAVNPFRGRDVEDMYENFMDGGKGTCKNTFTPQQKVRVRWALLNTRRSLLESGACVPVRRNLALAPAAGPAPLRCDAHTTPRLYVRNAGNTDVTSFTLAHAFDDGPVALQSWSGQLRPGDSVFVSLPAATLLPGAHLLKVALTDVNGEGEDDDARDNILMQPYFFLPTPGVADSLPYCAGLEGGYMAPGWLAADPDQVVGLDLYPYSRCPEQGQYIVRYNSSGTWNQGNGPVAAATGTRDYLLSPVFDLTDYRTATLRFDVAYMAAAVGRDLTLRVYVAGSCGSDPVLVYEKSRLDLHTAAEAPDTSLVGWEPGGCEDWRTEVLDLDAYTGEAVFLVFELEVTGGYSQNLYLDNICLDAGGLCQVPAQIPTKPGLYVADNVCTDAEGWVHFWKAADTAPETEGAVLLFSYFDPRGETQLSPGEVSMLLTEGYGQGGHDLSETAPYVQNPLGWYTAGRCVSVRPQVQPRDSIWVRFYFDETDVADMAATVANVAQAEEMVVYHLEPGLNPDPRSGHSGIEADWFQEVRHDSVAGRESWHYAAHPYGYAATLVVDELGGMGVGSGGEGLGMGATYPVRPDLRGTQDLTHVQLEWTCAREWGTEGFTVFRAGADDSLFTPIGEVVAAGRSALATVYAFADTLPLPGRSRYKVVMRHRKGWDVTSDTVTVRFDPTRVVGVFPNPSRDWLQIEIEIKEPESVYFGVFTGGRQEMLRATWTHAPDTAHPVNIETLPPGIYFYNVTYSGGSYWGKLIKIDW